MSSSTSPTPGQVTPPWRRWWPVVATVVSALVTFAAFPPADFGAFAWVGIVPFLLALGQVRTKTGFWLGWLWGTVFMGTILLYISKFGILPWFALALAMGLFYGVFGLLAAWLRHNAVPWLRVPALAGAWVLLEMARGHAGAVALTMGDLAYSQSAQLPMIQFASLAGHYGVSFLVILLNAALATVLLALLPHTWWRPGDLRQFNRMAGRTALGAYALVFLVFFWGSVVMRYGQPLWQKEAKGPDGVRVAAVQGSVLLPPEVSQKDVRNCLNTYLRLSHLRQPADLIVWPETAVPTALNYSYDIMRRIEALARSQHSYLLVGGAELKDGKIFNSAYFLNPRGVVDGIYRKMDLVLFGEYVPFRKEFKFLKDYPIRTFDYSPGTRREVFHTKHYSLAPLICFESIFPGPTRQVVRAGADVVVLITSDAWALNTFELQQHSATAPFRAIESRRPVIRAATDGLSAVYDPYGEAIDEVPYYLPGAAEARISVVNHGLSIYDQLGDWPLAAISLAALLLGLLAVVKGYQGPPAPAEDTSGGNSRRCSLLTPFCRRRR